MGEWRDKIGIGVLHACTLCGTVSFKNAGPDTMTNEMEDFCPVCKRNWEYYMHFCPNDGAELGKPTFARKGVEL